MQAGGAVTEWFAFGTGSPRHLMLDPDHCTLCGECEKVCPWEAVYAMPEETDGGESVFIVEDHSCTRCNLCVERCPSDCLYFARLWEEPARTRTLGVVPRRQGVVA